MEQKYIESEDFSLVNTKIKKTGTKSNKNKKKSQNKISCYSAKHVRIQLKKQELNQMLFHNKYI